MTNPGSNMERLLELMADDACGELDPRDRAELDRLLADEPSVAVDSIDMIAAALIAGSEMEPMPQALRDEIVSERTNPGPVVGRIEPQSSGSLAWTGWVAAAAAIVLGAFLWMNRPTTLSPGEVRDELLVADGTRQADWGAWDDPEQPGVTGKVIWNESQQTGVMEFSGIAVNDPSVEQYQLWIIDERGMEQRVSGGVFDIETAGDSVLVRIDPAVKIQNAAAFAITIERPGGVWVSDMTRRVVIAAL